MFKVKVDRAKPKRLEFLDDSPDPEEYRQAGMAAAEELAVKMREQRSG